MDQHPYTLLAIAKLHREKLLAKAEVDRLLHGISSEAKRERRRSRSRTRASSQDYSTRLSGRSTPQ